MKPEFKIDNSKVKEIVAKEVKSSIEQGILFTQTGQKFLNPKEILDVNVPEDDINIHPFDMNMSVIMFVVVIAYTNGWKFSFNGIANFQVGLNEPGNPDDLFTSYKIDPVTAHPTDF